MADIIQLLPDHVANQIAAGEVVQRPASVVKELMENAVDAGAGTIKLIVKSGGKAVIQVVDDGKGMSPMDARMSFERHATSKITTADDLFQIHTKGFRGEALASIAAISHVVMHTRLKDDELGTCIQIEGSEVVEQAPIASAMGTSISVKNLFYNVPARRNFLKSDKVELRHITDEFHRIALAHPQVGFQFFHNESELFGLPPTSLRKRITHIFGRKTDEKLVPVKEETGVVKIEGFILKPEFAKKRRGEQFFFVNNRFIKNSYLHHAVVHAYEGLLRQGTFPGYFLFFTVDPAAIDINIHPTKTEVKFEDEHTIYAVLRSALKHSLGQFNVAPAIDFEADANLQTPYGFKDRMAKIPKVQIDPDFNPFKPVAPTANLAGRKPVKEWEALYVGLASGWDENRPVSAVEHPSKISGVLFPEETEEGDLPVQTLQFNKKYILATLKSGILVIHQSRAHQRVLYEQFLRQLTGSETISQQLLFPLKLTFTPKEVTLLTELRNLLESFGFEFNALERDNITITGVPPLVSEGQVGVILDEILAKHETSREHEISQPDSLAKILCKSLSIKAGRTLQPADQIALVNDLFGCKETGHCPFKKPIFITVSQKEIEKKFS